MSTPVEERRSEPRRDDPSIRFRWAGARVNEPVANFSASGAKLMTVRSAPVGSLVEFDLQHADGASISLMGTVRRVERAIRKSGGDGRLALSVEYTSVDGDKLRMLREWQSSVSSATSEVATEGAETEQPTRHEGQLWQAGPDDIPEPAKPSERPDVEAAVSDLFDGGGLDRAAVDQTHADQTRAEQSRADQARVDQSRADRADSASDSASENLIAPASEVAQDQDRESSDPADHSQAAALEQEQLIAELQHRVAQAEAAAAAAQQKLASAEERLEHLGVYESEASPASSWVGSEPAELVADEAGDQGAANEIMVDALLDSGDVEARATEALGDQTDGEDEPGTGGPISSAVRKLEGIEFTSPSAGPSGHAGDSGEEPLAQSEIANHEVEASVADVGDLSEENLATRAFSQDLIASARKAAELEDDSDPLAAVDVGDENTGSSEVEPPEGDVEPPAWQRDSDTFSPASPTPAASPAAEATDEEEELQGPDSGGFVEAIPRVTPSEQAWPDLDLEAAEAATVQLGQPLMAPPAEATERPAGDDGVAVGHPYDSANDSAAFSLEPQALLEDQESAASDGAGSDPGDAQLNGESAVVEEIAVEDLVIPDDGGTEVGAAPTVTVAGNAADAAPTVSAASTATAFDAAAQAPRAALTFREIPTREGMISAMASGTIARTERFGRLEPVSRADIQVSDLLMETDDLQRLEEMSTGVLEREQLHKVLYVFFQRGLIEVQPD